MSLTELKEFEEWLIEKLTMNKVTTFLISSDDIKEAFKEYYKLINQTNESNVLVP